MNTSTKPFRRAGALVLAYLYLLLMSAYIAGCTGVAKLTGTVFVIDQIENPTLARTQRILRARNAKKREKEYKALEKQRNERQDRLMLEMKTRHEADRADDQAHHKKLTDFWDGMYKQARAKEIEEELLAALEKKRKEEAAFEERRQRELAMWQEAEEKRLAEFKEKQRIQDELDKIEKQRVWGELDQKKRELEQYYTLAQQIGTDNLVAAGGLVAPRETRYDIENGSYGDRFISVHSAYVRLQANRQAQILNNLVLNEPLSVDGWTVGEELYGNPIWFHQKPGNGYLAGWIWSGALNNVSTSALPRMSDDIVLNARKQLSKNSEAALDVLTEMHANPDKYRIQNEIAALQSEINELNARVQPKPKPVPKKFGTISTQKITASKIYSGGTIMDANGVRPNKFRTINSVHEAIYGASRLSLQDLDDMQDTVRAKWNISKTNYSVGALDQMKELVALNDAITERRSRVGSFTSPPKLMAPYDDY